VIVYIKSMLFSIVVWIFESMHVIGLALLSFVVFPELDVIKGIMLTNCLAILPGLFGMLSRGKHEQKR
jgi:chitin synthase